MSLTAKYRSSYRKTGNGQQVFVYTVEGTAKEKERFAQIQTDRGITHKDDVTGELLFFITPMVNGQRRILAPSLPLTITTGPEPKVVYDDTPQQFNRMAKVDALMDQEIAKLMAAQWMQQSNNNSGSVLITPAAPAQTTTQPAVTEQAAVAELENGGTEELE